MSASHLYDQDFYAWANEQAALLRSGRLAEADIAHIAEARETGLDRGLFPVDCPWSYTQIIDEGFWPDAF